MKIQYWHILIFTVLLYSCTSGSSKKGYHKSAHGSTVDTLIVDTAAAVFYTPDTNKIARAKKDDPDDFSTAADDNMYYMDLARQFLERKHVNIVDVNGEKYIKFIGENNTCTIVAVDTLSELWGIYLFDEESAPENADMVNIEEEYRNYFE